MTSQAGQTLSHYRLIEKIGEGGMGVVWKAEDTILKRPVAIKILPPDAARDDVRRRMFLEEARLASSLTDAHIAQVHELGREGDLDFIVMELVEGKPLSRILHGRPLPPDKVASLGLQVAQALARAHRKCLLHRDLKPGNILVTPEGEVKVVDFGLATLLGPRDTSILSDASTQTTESSWRAGEGKGTGAALVGTLPYMSPEQARGEKLDARSDIFSLGVVLYEMTTGQRPFPGATSAELLRQIARARPRPPHELVPKLPLELDRIIQKTLAPARANRYQTMEDLGVDLKQLGRALETGSSPTYEDLKETPIPERHRIKIWVLSGTFLVAVIATGLWRLGPWRMGGADARTILILPMEVRGQADGADYLGRAFAEAIAVNLVQSKELRVLPVPAAGPERTSDALGPAKTARDVGAGRLLTGALTRDGGIVHAGLSLVDAQENRILWGAQRDAAGSSLPALAASLAQEVATALGARPRRLYDHFMNPSGNQDMVNSTEMTEALGALRRWETAPAMLEATRRLVDAFPNEPNAHALRTWALCAEGWLRGRVLPPSSPKWKEMEDSLANLERLDPNSPWHDVLQAWWSFDETGRGREAIEVYTRVLQRDDLTPAARAFILSFRGNVHTILGDTAAGVADLVEALRLDPANDSIYAIHASDLNAAGRYSEALTFARQAVALSPTDDYNQSMLSWALRGLGRWEESLAPAAKYCELRPGQGSCAWYAVALQGAGRAQEAQEKAREAAALTDSSQGARALACYWVLVGNRSETLRLLSRAVELGAVDLAIMREPLFKPLRGDPEFERILAEAKRLDPSPAR